MSICQDKELALQEATQVGRFTGILYRKVTDSLSCDFFGDSTLTWRRGMMYNSTLDDTKYFKDVINGSVIED